MKKHYLLLIVLIFIIFNDSNIYAQYSTTSVFKQLDLENLSRKECFYIDSVFSVNDSFNDIDKIKYYSALYNGFINNNIPLMAITYINSLIPLFEKSDNKEELANLYSNKSLVHDNLGQYPQALTASQMSLKIFIEIGDKLGEAYAYNDIGILHYYNGNDSLSADYHDKSYEIFKDFEDTNGMSMYYNNKANTLYEMEQYPSAIVMYTKARELNIALNDKGGEAIALSNIGETYLLLGDYKKAEEILLEALEIAEETKIHGILPIHYVGLENYID